MKPRANQVACGADRVSEMQLAYGKVICPNCRAEIPLGDVNVSTDIALCRRCGKTSSFAEAVAGQSAGPIDLTRPPKGTWLKRHGSGFELGTTTRSAIAFFLVPFMCVWSGGALGGIYGSQIVKGHFNLGMSLFGIPFLIGTLIFGSIAIMSACGKILIRVEGSQGTLFRGVGPIGWKQRFNWSAVTGIRRTQRMGRNSTYDQITIDAAKELSFASGVKRERFEFLLAALREMQKEYRF
jgi:hypothetical protein